MTCIPRPDGQISWDRIIPCFARRVLRIGPVPEQRPDLGEANYETTGSVSIRDVLSGQQVSGRKVQCLLIGLSDVNLSTIRALMARTDAMTVKEAQVVFFFDAFHGGDASFAGLETLLAEQGWIVYRQGHLCGPQDGPPPWIVITVRSSYNPVEHARRMAEAGGGDCAVSILKAIPEDLIGHEKHQDLLNREIQRIAQSLEKQPAPGPDPLHLGLVKGEGYGWGVCSNYLIRELTGHRPVHVLKDRDGEPTQNTLAGTLFQALTNVDFDPLFPLARAERNIGYTFFENELTPRSIENAKRYDLVLGGSTWCRDRMLEKGISNCDILLQGIDPDLFFPITTNPAQDRFVIFSGGKFELRKGQDLVLKAVKVLQDRYPDVWLVNCWYNLWPASTKLMGYSGHIRFRHEDGEPWDRTMHRTYKENGLDPDRIVTHQLLPQGEQRGVFAQTDIGVFPNRCEGGTNLVLMEYMACARPVIASNTSGHKDIVTQNNALLLNALSPFEVKEAGGHLIARWEEPSLDELIARLDYAYHHRSAVQAVGRRAGDDLKPFTWSRSAGRLLDFIDGLEIR